MSGPKRSARSVLRCWSRRTTASGRTTRWDGCGGSCAERGAHMRIHQWQLRGPDRTVKELLPETPPTVVGHGILEDNMLYLTARHAEDGMLFRVFLNPDDLRRLLHRAMEQRRRRRSFGRLPDEADSQCQSGCTDAVQSRQRSRLAMPTVCLKCQKPPRYEQERTVRLPAGALCDAPLRPERRFG